MSIPQEKIILCITFSYLVTGGESNIICGAAMSAASKTGCVLGVSK